MASLSGTRTESGHKNGDKSEVVTITRSVANAGPDVPSEGVCGIEEAESPSDSLEMLELEDVSRDAANSPRLPRL
ncbi:hypothetical protein K402DRAFT_396462, partial [Aulographum hederae CBS 113979]